MQPAFKVAQRVADGLQKSDQIMAGNCLVLGDFGEVKAGAAAHRGSGFGRDNSIGRKDIGDGEFHVQDALPAGVVAPEVGDNFGGVTGDHGVILLDF